MPRLPKPGSDHNQWGDILNNYLRVAHNEDGTLSDAAMTSIVTPIVTSAVTNATASLTAQIAAKYTQPAGGVPKADLSQEVRDALDSVGGQTGPEGPQGPQGNPGQGVPAGGASGQVLAKTSGADYATQWVTPTSGGGSVSYADLPAGTTLTVMKVDGAWPARPTSRNDIIVQWKGPDPAPAIVSSGTEGMLNNVDMRFVTPA